MRKLFILPFLIFISCNDQSKPAASNNKTLLNDLTIWGLKGRVKKMTLIQYMSGNIAQRSGAWAPIDSSKASIDIFEFDADGNLLVNYRIVDTDHPLDTIKTVLQYTDGRQSGFESFASGKKQGGGKISWTDNTERTITTFNTSGKTISEEISSFDKFNRVGRSEDNSYNDSGRKIYSYTNILQNGQYGSPSMTIFIDKETGKADTSVTEVLTRDAQGNETGTLSKDMPSHRALGIHVCKYEYY